MDHGQAGRDLLSSQPAGGSTQEETGSRRAAARTGEAIGTTRHARKTAPGDGWFTGSGARPGLPLLAVLVVQALLSVRLLGADTAFMDEAAYLWAGHLEWAHWLHGAAIPSFSSYFSGAPVMYPPLGALADSVGGLAGARLLSLAFMLSTTVLLWTVTSRLFGRQAGFFAAALFAVAGPSLHLGAFAVYDAMSLFLLALAVWLVVGAAEKQEASGRMAAAGALVALANATAYSSALFDPVVVALALLTALPSGRRIAARRCASLVTVLVALLLVGILLGGSTYWHGISQTTLTRAGGAASPLQVLADAWSWTGVIIALALCGVIASWISRTNPARTWLLAVLTAAALLGPLEQAHLHTLASLNKHVGLGAWFAAIAAGYAVDKFIAATPAGQPRTLTLRGLPRRPGPAPVPGRHPVAGLRHQLAQLDRLHRDLPAAGQPRLRPPARRRPVDRRVLPARGTQLAALVRHPQHRPARRHKYRRPHPRWRRRGRRPRRLRPVHRPALLLHHRAQLRRHHGPGPPDRHRSPPQPVLPDHRCRAVLHRRHQRHLHHLPI